jgi:hypothetical protein
LGNRTTKVNVIHTLDKSVPAGRRFITDLGYETGKQVGSFGEEKNAERINLVT